ncbi:putative BT1 transmembrane domain-containing protein [Neospora caninum Liverpool]|uniref:BT1 transmembrane domain-containing protein,putative n=1 Tax=Neospora caninum (strain Liverpool) TaxID=572307 RepID=F0VB97_NEOCL|nr:putative BT1 transmembrane domain-containing protein [Neospora caninum Liverpool]CBZ50881.1 putative BT1 transmembrane domain-containing protein [Neospora caninum Liverpool]CEL68183.1 TPA: BT1 transmembrane domain-containing protein,putative [Neospora caninum Liverpool]|eukprot:XP_003880914.1 putative BT1 transmembrane domain-containing protein [Neospora caninum Liverpool]
MASLACCLSANPLAALAAGCWGRCAGKKSASAQDASGPDVVRLCTCSKSLSGSFAKQASGLSVYADRGSGGESRPGFLRKFSGPVVSKGDSSLEDGAEESGAKSSRSSDRKHRALPRADSDDVEMGAGESGAGADTEENLESCVEPVPGRRNVCPTCGGVVASPGETLILVPPLEVDEEDSVAEQRRKKTCQESCFDRLEHINPVNLLRFAARVRRHVGSPFFLLLLSVFGGVRGILYGLTHRSLLPYLKSIDQDAATYQGIDALGTVIWGMMGVVGTISDSVPLGGYHKRYYMLIANVVGVCGVTLLATCPAHLVAQNVWIVGLAMFLICTQMSTLVLMCSGKYSEMMEKNPEMKADIVTFVFMCWMVGNLIGTSIVGPISDAVGTQPLYYLALPIAAQSVVPIVLGFLPEEKVQFRILTNKLLGHKRFFLMALAIGVAATGVVVITIAFPGSSAVMIPYCSLVSVFLIALCLFCLPPKLAKCNLYLFLWGLVNVSVSGALDFFYTASPKCLPDGPHFDYTYYATYISVAGALANWAGIWVFHSFLADWTFRHVFWLSIAVRAVASLFDYVMVLRLNLYIGIPDKFMYLFGDAIILNLVNTLNHMPGYILTSRLCPTGLESTAYAVMDGMSHLGWNFSKQFGVFATELAGIATGENSPGGCDFNNLGNLALITQVALPLLAIPLSFLLLPNSPMSERVRQDLDENVEADKTDEGKGNLELKDRGISESTKCSAMDRGSTTTSVAETVTPLTGVCTPGGTSAVSDVDDGVSLEVDDDLFFKPAGGDGSQDDVEAPERSYLGSERRMRLVRIKRTDADMSDTSQMSSEIEPAGHAGETEALRAPAGDGCGLPEGGRWSRGELEYPSWDRPQRSGSSHRVVSPFPHVRSGLGSSRATRGDEGGDGNGYIKMRPERESRGSVSRAFHMVSSSPSSPAGDDAVRARPQPGPNSQSAFACGAQRSDHSESVEETGEGTIPLGLRHGSYFLAKGGILDYACDHEVGAESPTNGSLARLQ